jgi:hypothetical protein
MPNATLSYQAVIPQTTETEDVPEWADGVLSTKRGPTMGEAVAGDPADFNVVEQVDRETGLCIFGVPGLQVIAMESTTDPRTAVELADRLKVHELDLAAIAFAGPIPYEAERFLAARGILIANTDAESPRARARKYAAEFALRAQHGAADLQRFFLDMAAQRR